MTETAAGEGLDFRFDIARAGNTFDGHRIVHLAAEHGLQDAMKERLLRAYLSEGELISDPETLTRLAAEVGLPEDEVAETLAGDRFAEDVRDRRAGRGPPRDQRRPDVRGRPRDRQLGRAPAGGAARTAAPGLGARAPVARS